MTAPRPRTNPAATAPADTAWHLTAMGFPATASNPAGFCDAVDVSFACDLRAHVTHLADPTSTASTGWSACVHDETVTGALADVSTADSSVGGLVALLLFGLSLDLRPAASTPRSLW